MKVLFAVRSYRHFPQFRKTVTALAARGHRVTVLIYKNLTDENIDEIRKLENMPREVTFDWMVPSRRGGTFIFHARELLSYRKHLVVSGHATFYADRWKEYLHPKLDAILNYRIFRSFLKLPISGLFLGLFEVFTPPQRDVMEHIRTLNPDALVASPVNLRYSSMELEYLKAASALGIPTALPMASWDNITSKGLYHVWPDRFLVWNKVQVREMAEHHGVPEKKVRIVGATTLDQWFPPPPPLSLRDFCEKYGLREKDPILSYFGSSINAAGDESWLAEEVRQILDETNDPELKKVQLLVRPHPKNFKIYSRIQHPNIMVVPKDGPLKDPNDEQFLFFNTLYHSMGVSGINTSAMLDAMVVGRPVIAFDIGERATMQMETYHFPQLVRAGCIAFIRREDREEIRKLVKEILHGRDLHRAAREEFVNEYIRPRGVAAGEAIAEEIEKLVEEKREV